MQFSSDINKYSKYLICLLGMMLYRLTKIALLFGMVHIPLT